MFQLRTDPICFHSGLSRFHKTGQTLNLRAFNIFINLSFRKTGVETTRVYIRHGKRALLLGIFLKNALVWCMPTCFLLHFLPSFHHCDQLAFSHYIHSIKITHKSGHNALHPPDWLIHLSLHSTTASYLHFILPLFLHASILSDLLMWWRGRRRKPNYLFSAF